MNRVEVQTLMIIFIHHRKHINKEKNTAITKIALTRKQCKTY